MTGTVELPLPATELILPTEVTPLERDILKRAANQDWSSNPTFWVNAQMTRLILASALEARLLHVRGGRLDTFNLTRNPQVVTLRQLASLNRPHPGVAGQAFELAVADACEHGVPEVVGPIVEGLRLLGIRDVDRPRMVVLGLEKIPPAQTQQFYDELGQLLPASAGLRTGRPGRPPSTATVLARLASSSWGSMLNPALGEQAPAQLLTAQERAERSQLGRADAFVYTDTALVPTSLKINRGLSRRGWQDVPLWISGSRSRDRRSHVESIAGADHPTVVVNLGANTWLSCFDRALTLLSDLFCCLDGGACAGDRLWRPETPMGMIFQRLRRLADEPVAEVVRQLRDIHPEVSELYGHRVGAQGVLADVPVLNAPSLVQAWHDTADNGGLLVGQRHLFYADDQRRSA